MVEKTGGGRAPCCDKTKVKRGPWSPDEDLRLSTFIRNYGHTNWRALPKQAGLLRCGKSCRLRWINYLTPDVKRGNFTPQEEQTIINLHNSFGNKWSKIASYLPGRTDNEIKNMWNTHLKKRLKNNHSSILANSSSSSSTTLSSFSSSKDQCSGQLKKVDIDRVVQESKSPKPNKDDSNNSPASSYASNFTNSNDATSEFSKFVEVAHDTEIHDDEEIEIPLESDTDFWNLFDSLDTDLESNNNINVVSNSNIINPVEKVDDGNDWFRLLENELGLTCDVDMNLSKDQKHVPTTLEPEIGPGLDYFPIWPSSPQNLGI